jgi:uncharacterized damage-inducible protein DinB
MHISILKGSHPAYYQNYLSQVSDGPVLEVFHKHWQETSAFWQAISEDQSKYRYAKEKWSIKEMLLHIIDTDRVFGSRAFALSRGEKQELLSFSQDDYASQSEADRRSWKSLLEEYEAVKTANYILFQSFSEKQWRAERVMGGAPISTLALAYVMPGHDLHHLKVCKERYLDFG